MKNRTLFLIWINLLLGVVVALCINVVTGAELIEKLKWAGIYEYRVHILIASIVLSLIFAGLHARQQNAVVGAPAAVRVPEAERLKAKRAFVQDLTNRYQTRYQHKLDGRFEISLVVSEDLEGADEQQFDEEFHVDAQAGSAAQYIIELFEKRGRLLIVGSPGAGKTVLLLKLALHLIAKAQADANQPLPVIFNLASWSPEYARFDDWLKAVLTQGYGLSADFAATLLREGQIVILLDGLDELARNEPDNVAAEIRQRCLAALNLSLYDGARNVVICCRREEFLAMRNLTGAEGPVAAKVAVQDLTIGQIEQALIRARGSEKDRFAALHLMTALRQDDNGAFREVLTTPFFFTLALHVFDYSEPPQIDAPDTETLECNLMRGFVEKKIQVTENKENFSVAHVFVWLGWLARFLETRQLVVFELANLQPAALRRRWLGNLANGLSMALLFGVVLGTRRSPFFYMGLGFIAGILFWRNEIETEDVAKWSLSPLLTWQGWLEVFSLTVLLALCGLGAFTVIELASTVFIGWDFDVGMLFYGLVWGVGYGIFYGLAATCRQISWYAKLSHPYQRLRAGIMFNMLQMGGSLAAFTVAVGMFEWVPTGWQLPLRMFIGGSVLGFFFTPLYRHCVLRFCLKTEGAMPIKYVTFLRYATELRVLEEEGGQWRFRHQNFQDYFAARE